MTQRRLKNVVVCFDLPFVLRLVDSTSKDTVPKGYQHYTAVLNGIPVQLRFDIKLRDLGGLKIATEDRRGLLNYSAVQVWFDKQSFNAMDIDDDYGGHDFFSFALECVNHFLEIYRKATNSFWIRRVKRGEIALFRMVARMWDGKEIPHTQGTLGTGRGLGSLVTPEEDYRIRQDLLSGYVPNELERFSYLVDALYDQEDFWSAALACEIRFEAYFARLLRRAFIAKGVSENEIDQKFENTTGFPRSITNLLNTYVYELTKVKIDDASAPIGSAYDKWASNARDLRNDIAHGKQLTISANQALAAISAVKDFMQHLDEIFKLVLTTTK